MAYLRHFLVFCSIVYVLSNSKDCKLDEMESNCCSECRCEYTYSYYGEKQDWEVDCSNRSLTEVPNCPWENFTRVDLRRNKIKKIPKDTFQRFKNIRVLDLSENQLSYLPEPNITMGKLKDLNLNQNKFTEIPAIALSRMPNLKLLYMKNNCIPEIPSTWKQQKLISLELDHNKFEKFPFIGPKMMPNLEILYLRSNKITEIPENALGYIKNIQSLILHNNRLESIHPNFPGNNTESLLYFDFSDNKNLSTIKFETFRKLRNLRRLRFANTNIMEIPDLAFEGLNYLKTIDLSAQTGKASKIGKRAFANLPQLDTLSLSDFGLNHFPNLTGTTKLENLILRTNNIKRLPDNLCDILPELEDLDLTSNKLTVLPSLSRCKKLLILKLSSNQLKSFGDSLQGLESLLDIEAKYNKIESIGENTFKGLTQLESLFLQDNEISKIDKNAFSDLQRLKILYLSNNEFPELPSLGMGNVERLSIKGNSILTKFPSRRNFPNIKTLHLYYPYHCCAFLNERKESPLLTNLTWPHEENLKFTWTWVSQNNTQDPFQDFSASGGEEGDSEPDDDLTYNVECTPEPGPFVPCDDLMGDWVLRCGVWIVFVLALCGNATVIIVILASHTKIDVSRFLISNLAFADLFMGIYLGFLAVVDISTLGNFRSYGVEWQLSAGCRTAGFLATLSSELSVFTLTVITLERYIAIKNAIRVNRRLQLKTAIIVMLVGWTFALVTATLPLLEINSYGRFSICLPFEIGDLKSIVYVVFLLCLNAAAFVIILFCYILMYCSIRGSNAWNASDLRVAKRMALLVFTDFACWAPIVFFSLSATFGSTIINLNQAKIFTVFVFPLNSCANPFLYAIFTSHFKKDLLAICKRVEEKYPFLKITKHRLSFSRRSSYSGAVSENANMYLRIRRFSLPVFPKGFTNSITTNGRTSDSSNSNKNSSDTNALAHDCNEQLLTERETSV